MNAHDGAGDELVHRVGWFGNYGRDVTIFKAVKVGLDGVILVPWGSKGGVVGLTFGG